MHHVTSDSPPCPNFSLCFACSAGIGRTGTIIVIDILIDIIGRQGTRVCFVCYCSVLPPPL